MTIKKEYLGDSVYVEWDGYMLRLFLDNGYEEKNEIFLEPESQIVLVKFIERMIQAK